MTDHRRLQRALFRLQLDHDLARAVLSGDAASAVALGLADADLALLRSADLAGVTADPGGRRRTQVLANASSEFTLTLAAVAERDPAFLWAFARSPELHGAIDTDRPLPFAFAAYAEARLRAADEPLLLGLLRLEQALAICRRAHRHPADATASAGGDTVALVHGGVVLELPGGAFVHAEALRAALDRQEPAPMAPRPAVAAETIVVVPRGPASPHTLADAHAERLEPPADALLRAIAAAPPARPFDPARRAAFAQEVGATAAALETFLDELVADGILVR